MPLLRSLFSLDPQVTFLNHGSFGATPLPVMQAYQDWQRRLERQPVLFLGRQYHALMREARQALATYLHADVNDLVFIPNATHGANIIARSLDLQPGDEIVTTDHEYGACDLVWEFAASRAGARIVRQHIPLPLPDEAEIVNLLWQGVSARTRAIYLSNITSPTAMLLPVEAVCRRARRAGILSVVDAAHSPGQIPIDLTAMDADVVFGNCHKWMLAPKGAGFLHVRRDLQPRLQPLVVSWGSAEPPEMTTGSRFIDLFEWTGTHDPAAALSVPAAIEFMREHDWESVRVACRDLLRQTLARLAQLGFTSPYSLASDCCG